MPAARPVVLLPPSEGKAAGGSHRFDLAAGSFGDLAPQREQLVAALVREVSRASAVRRASLLGVRGDLLARAVDALDDLAAGTARSLPAATRYTGVVWEHLRPATIDRAARQRILVPSALLGVTTAADPVPDYRLKFSVVLRRLGRLDRWWRPALTDVLATRVARRTVIDLLPNEHRAAFDLVAVAARCDLVTVRFLQHDGRSAAGHAAKAAKGTLARVALERGVEGVATFEWQGWRARRSADGVDVVASG